MVVGQVAGVNEIAASRWLYQLKLRSQTTRPDPWALSQEHIPEPTACMGSNISIRPVSGVQAYKEPCLGDHRAPGDSTRARACLSTSPSLTTVKLHNPTHIHTPSCHLGRSREKIWREKLSVCLKETKNKQGLSYYRMQVKVKVRAWKARLNQL